MAPASCLPLDSSSSDTIFENTERRSGVKMPLCCREEKKFVVALIFAIAQKNKQKEPAMSEQLMVFVQRLKVNRNLTSYNEDAAKQAMVLPVLQMLGWDIFNVEEVVPEFSVGNGRVDYCLLANGARVFLEAKKPSEDLDRHQEQLLGYAFHEGVKLAVLTNGITWSLYLPLKEGNWQNRLFYTVDIIEQDSNEVASRFTSFLSKASVASGSAIKNAEAFLEGKRKQEIIEETIPDAWNKITSELDPKLVELLAERTGKLCGFQPMTDDIVKFFQRYGDHFLLQPPNEQSQDKPTATSLPPLKKAKAVPIQDIKKISQDELIPHIVKILKQHGGGAAKETVDTEIFRMFQSTFEHPWYQELVSYGVPRWQHNVAWARERAKRRGIIKPPGPRGRGFWELTDEGKNLDI